MALKLDDKPGSEYDDGNPSWRTNLKDDELDDVRSLPETTDENLPPKHPDRNKKSTPEELSNQETTAAQGASASKAEEKEDSLFNKSDDNQGVQARFRGIFTRRRVVGGGIAGLVVGSVFGVLTVTSGPLQFIHLAQLLRGFHFANQEDAGDDRMSKIFRYVRYHGDERTRLNIMGNKYADHIEARMKEEGIESSYTERTRFLDGYIIDPTAIPDKSDLATIKDTDVETAKSKLSEQFNIDPARISIEEGGKIRLDMDGLGYSDTKKLMRGVLETVGFSRIGAALRARLLATRGAVTWHPMKKLDKKLLEKTDRLLAWRKERQKRINDGEESVSTRSTAEEDKEATASEKEEAGKAKSETDAVKGEVDAAKPEVEGGTGGAAATEGSNFAKLRTSTGLKLAGGVTAAIGILCTLKGVSDNFDQIKQAQVVLPLMRMGMETMTLGNQVMNGKDADLEQLGFYAQQLSDAKTGSWAGARSIQAEEGKPLTGADIPSEARIPKDGNIVGQLIGGIPGLGTVCEAAGSFIGQAASFAIDFIGGPVSAIGGQVLSFATGPALEAVTNWLAGNPIDINVAGADFGNYVNYGVRLAANDSMISAGGRELSAPETAALRVDRQNSNALDQESKSFAQRMFNPYDSSSLVGKIIDQQNPSIGTNVNNVATSLLSSANVFGSISKTFSGFLGPKASAAVDASYDYGFPKYGFSMGELNNAATKNPFDNAEKVADMLGGPNGSAIMSKAQKCFNINLDAKGNVTSKNESSAYPKIPDDCKDTSTEWLRVRFYIFDTQMMSSYACFEDGDSQACKDVGFGVAQGTTTTGQATSANIYVLGDSLTDGMRSAGLANSLQAKGWLPTIMAECGRSLTRDGSSCSPNQVLSGLNQVDQPADQAAIKQAGVVVIGLGTNDKGSATFGDDVTAMINKIKSLNPSAKIYWTNLYSTDEFAGAYQAMNSTLAGLAGSSGFNVIDWASQAPKVGAYSPGQFHPDTYQPLVDFVVSQLGQAP